MRLHGYSSEGSLKKPKKKKVGEVAEKSSALIAVVAMPLISGERHLNPAGNLQ